MKRKHWIILICVLVAIAIGIALYFWMRPTLYQAQSIDPRTLHASPNNYELMLGLWQRDEHIYYRFNADSTGCTWDVADDLTEAEASHFEWKAYEEAVMMTHKLRIRGVVPRYYELDRLNAFDMRFHDTYMTYAFERVEEAVALEE